MTSPDVYLLPAGFHSLEITTTTACIRSFAIIWAFVLRRFVPQCGTAGRARELVVAMIRRASQVAKPAAYAGMLHETAPKLAAPARA
jgi:hypothetical protein